VIETKPDVAWLEVHTENYMGGGRPVATLDKIRTAYPISLHGVGLSLGSAGELDAAHLERIAEVARRIEPALVSEHLSWSAVDGRYLADLLPLPMTEEALAVVCRHVDAVQGHLGRRILVENPSSYLRWRHSTIPECEFLATVAARTGCGILCDVNNIYVSAANHGWDAAGRGRRNPSRRPFGAGIAERPGPADRRPRLARHPRGLDALCAGAGALRSGADAD
jgi:uncharacterized protein (UPF0276 family)